MRKLNIGIIGGIGAGKDTLGQAIVGQLNGLVQHIYGKPIAHIRKFAEHLHWAAGIVGFNPDRGFKETQVEIALDDIAFAVREVTKLIYNAQLCTATQRGQGYIDLVTHFLKTYGLAGANTLLISPRQFMQDLGNLCREIFGEDIWVDLVLPTDDFSINLFTDTRFQNEVDALDLIIYIKSDRALLSPNVSEALASTYEPDAKCIQVVINNKDNPLSGLLGDAATLAAGIYGIVTKL